VLIIWRRQHDVAYTQHIFHIMRQVLTQNFSPGEGEGADPEAVCNLCCILKIMLEEPCLTYNCNITLFVTVFIYLQIQLHLPWLTHLV